jgi:COMPASS component BRE2
VAVREGTWYYEAIVERGDGGGGGGRGSGGDSGNPHVRIGWGRREAGLDAPVGADAYAYAIRDVGGEKVHISRPKAYAGRSFGTGDVVGCLIHLPPREEATNADEPGYVRRWRIPLRYKGQLYFEMDEYPAAKEMEALVNREGKAVPAADEKKATNTAKTGGVKKTAVAETTAAAETPVSRTLPTLPGSHVAFFLNGEPLGTAFENLYDFLPLPPLPGTLKKKYSHAYDRERETYQYHDDGTLGYFPMISCFGRGKVRLNFGPEWIKPPRVAEGAHAPAPLRPLCDRWPEFAAQQVIYDERDEAHLADKLVKDMAAAAEAKAKARAKALAAPVPKRRDKKRRKETTGTPGAHTPGAHTPGPDTPASGTPRERTVDTHTPASSPRGGRAQSVVSDTQTPYDHEHVPSDMEAAIEPRGYLLDDDAAGDTDADAEGEDEDGGEDAHAGVAWD